jgi:hypothetical protein
MANKNPSATVVTERFIISYPKLLKAEPYVENGKPKGDPVYSFEGISEVDSLNSWNILDKEKDAFVPGSVEKLCVSLAKEKWGADFDVRAAVQHGGLSWPFKSGDKKAETKGEKAAVYRGKKFWRAKALAEINGTPNEPALYFADKDGQLVKLLKGTENGKQRINESFYGGAICTAELNVVAGETAKGKYVTFYVNSVIFETDGDRLGGGSAVERLRGVKGGATKYDPTEGMKEDLEDEIPF